MRNLLIRLFEKLISVLTKNKPAPVANGESDFVHSDFTDCWNKGLIDRDFVVTIGNKNYYRNSKQGMDICYVRFDQARQFSHEHSTLGANRELMTTRLVTVSEWIKEIMQSHDFDKLSDIRNMIYIAIGDLDFGNPAQERLDLMSCFFFGHDESPYVYDEDVNRDKKLFWVKNLQYFDSFFLKSSFLGSTNMLETYKSSTESVTKISNLTVSDLNMLEAVMLQRIAKQHEDGMKSNGLNSVLRWRSAMALPLMLLNERLLSNFTDTGNTELKETERSS